MSRRRARMAVLAVLLGAGALLAASRLPAGSDHRAPAALGTAVASARPAVAADPPSPAPLDPLTIASMRSRAYPASVLTPVRQEGEQGGYANTVVSFQSDGLTEYALMSVPDGPRPKAGWPVIIVNHGYVDPTRYVTDDGLYAQFIAAYARAGYMVLKPDYRGNGRSQGVAEGGHMSPVYAYDVLNLISSLKQDPRVDPRRIGLFGHSMGGQEALRAMVVSKDVRAVVFMAGVVGSFYDLFYNWPHRAAPTGPTVATQQQVGQAVLDAHGLPPAPTASSGTPGGSASPASSAGAAFWYGASAINYVAFTGAAVQINQDVDDSQVPKLFSDHLASALAAADKTVDYITYPGDDHQFRQNRGAILANAVAFYRAHL